MQIAILGRQSALSIAELESLFGSDAITPVGDIAALVDADGVDIQRLGGSPKAGRVIAELTGDWQHVARDIEKHYSNAWREVDHKITLGLSAYSSARPPAPRQLQALGLSLKKARKNHPGSLRLIPNADSELSTATSHHNKLGLSPHKIELLIVQAPSGITYLAESTGSQNITALAARDQARPRTDAFVGMLPPKLARMMINMSVIDGQPHDRQTPGAGAKTAARIFDPFCGTGTVLQEALLMGYQAQGSDLSEKMVAYSQENIQWLSDKNKLSAAGFQIEQADATKHTWEITNGTSVVCETYLGQPFSAPPSPAKLREVRDNCNHIISSFLVNIHGQLPAGTSLTVAVPAWSDARGHFTHLPLTRQLDELGYKRRQLKHARSEQLLYHREGQVVAREILLLERA